MIIKKDAQFSAATLNQAIETVATSRQTTIPNRNHTILKRDSQTGNISDFLLAGQSNAIPLRHLVSITGRSSRAIRKQIEAERRQGIPILSDNLSGYYLPASDDEQNRFIRSMRHRAGEILKSAEAIEKGGFYNE